MGRPPKEKSEQRQQIGFRLSPADRARLDAVAEVNGRSVGQEVEARIVASLDYDDQVDSETRDLIAAILEEIKVIQTLTKKRWHKDVTTWAAVHQMFRQGPLEWARPDSFLDDEVVNEAWKRLYDLKQRRSSLVRAMTDMGVAMLDSPISRKVGLFGTYSSRNAERTAIESIEHDEIKGPAILIFDKIVLLDGEIAEADEQYANAIRPYWNTEKSGRNLYSEHRKQIGIEAMQNGERFYLSDIIRPMEVQ